MTALQGRLEVTRLKQRIDEAFGRVDGLPVETFELRADMARYLCILVCGYVERAVQELSIEWCRRQSGPTVVRYASSHLRRIQNLNSERLRRLLLAFETTWARVLDETFPEEVSALDSLYGNRNQIAHGGDVGLTLAQVRGYYDRVERLIAHLATVMDPV